MDEKNRIEYSFIHPTTGKFVFGSIKYDDQNIQWSIK